MRKQNIKKLRRFRDFVLWQKFFYNRGNNILDDFVKLLTLTTIVGLFVDKVNSAFGMTLSVGKAMTFVPLIMVVYWILGRMDYNHMHLVQKENEIGMSANPALYDKIKKISKDVKRIRKRVIFH